MILAGIDEAGYGPLLGPLVVGCCAFEVEDAGGAEAPCLWKRLGKLVSRHRSKTGRKLHINDSKQVYNPGIGLKELERSILCVAMASERRPASLDGFLNEVCPDAVADLYLHPWYAAPEEETFPLEQEMLGVSLFANGLRVEMERNQTRCIHLAARVVPERQLNNLMNQTRNKASALFSVAAQHLDHLLRTYGKRGLVIFCDRQGGREHYGQLLRLMFEDWGLEIVREEDGHSEYLLHHPKSKGDAPPAVRLMFKEKCEEQSMSVAVASMLSKYLREALMRRFNAFWHKYLPLVEPTAGYYNDGQRFLADIEAKRRELGIRDDELIRAR